MAPSIPDRWKDYKPVGQKIEGTRFVAFKVPLREQVSNNVARNIRLDGKILLNSIPKLGLIIDLTNTKRYYDPNFFKNAGVEYFKLMIPGREVPPRQLVDKFNDLVKEFLANNANNDKLIGVHCTHGVNRTGFLICNYMISEMTIDPNEAINRFAQARGHKIERTNYIHALQAPLTTTDITGTKTVEEQSPKINNWRDREDKLTGAKPRRNHWRDKQRVPEKQDNWRQRDNAARAEIANWRRRDEAYSRHRSRQAKSRSNSPNYVNNRGGNDFNLQLQSCNNINENFTSRYHYVREPHEEVSYRRPPLNIDYYSARPTNRHQRSNNLQRYHYHRSTHNS
ncbi:hypothetical protein DOY81_002687 [Sarcophaga bullata]|nr:hypothetical protein DOY81_002687 [Sarcophaga bullata]